MTNVVAIIPAKGNSRRIERKNMIPFGHGNKKLPLVQHTIHAALKSNVDSVYVVTDDHGTKSLANKLGAKTVMSPSWLTNDHVQAEMTVYYALFDIAPKPSVFVCLQPTSPLRDADDINGALELFYELNNSNKPYRRFFDPPFSVFSAYELDKFAYITKGMVAEPINHDPLFRVGSEQKDDLGLAVENGAIYIAQREQILRYKTFRVKPMVPYYMDVYESIEIDNPLDLAIAETIYAKTY